MSTAAPTGSHAAPDPGAHGAAAASPLAGRRLVLALTGGIACYKSAELLRLLTKAGAAVEVVMSDGATHYVAPLTFQALSGRRVWTSAWSDAEPNAMPHIRLGRDAEAIVVAPASADFLARLASGRADEIVALTCLARPLARCALLVAPAMNREMWDHPATRRNVAAVRDDGATVLGPGAGEQACGEVGDGRMLEPGELFDAIAAHFVAKRLAGRRIVVTAGPTFEAIDPVRGITNLSSGKMGFAIARAAADAGADVTLVAGPVALATPRGVARVDVRSALQMRDAVVARLDDGSGCDAFVATAAVADWRPAEVADAKLKKDGSGRPPALAFVENPDILAEVARRPDRPYCVGFAAESHDVLRHAREKRLRKGVPLIVANHGPATFGRDDNALVLIDDAGEREIPRADKAALARVLVAELAARLDAARGPATAPAPAR